MQASCRCISVRSVLVCVCMCVSCSTAGSFVGGGLGAGLTKALGVTSSDFTNLFTLVSTISHHEQYVSDLHVYTN